MRLCGGKTRPCSLPPAARAVRASAGARPADVRQRLTFNRTRCIIVVMTTRRSTRAQSELYYRLQPKYSRLTEIVVATLVAILDAEAIKYLTVQGRTKEKHSFIKKLKTKNYENVESMMTDISATRIIVYRESDIPLVQSLVQATFDVDWSHSDDKSKALGVDKVGYRSVHLVCRIGANRKELPEFRPFLDMSFEVQMRTVLAHAWAEIEHADYKLRVLSPVSLRDLNVISGLLERADRDLDHLSRKIESHSANIEEQIYGYPFRSDFGIEVGTIQTANRAPT